MDYTTTDWDETVRCVYCGKVTGAARRRGCEECRAAMREDHEKERRKERRAK